MTAPSYRWRGIVHPVPSTHDRATVSGPLVDSSIERRTRRDSTMTSRTIPQQPITTSYTRRPWWQLGLGAGVIAAVINSIIYYVYNAVATTPIQVTMLGRSEVQDLPVLGVVFFSLVPALLAALLAA